MCKIKLVRRKTYKPRSYIDLRIQSIKKYGILKAWRDYCDENGLTYYVI